MRAVGWDWLNAVSSVLTVFAVTWVRRAGCTMAEHGSFEGVSGAYAAVGWRLPLQRWCFMGLVSL